MQTARTRLEQAVLDARIRGERIIAIIRLVLLVPLSVFVVSLFLQNVANRGLGGAVSDPALYVELVCMVAAVVLSLWVLRLAREGIYRSWMPYVFPFLDVTFITVIAATIARYPLSSIAFTGAPPHLYYIFLVLCVFRNSPPSVVFTGVYAAVSSFALSYRSMAALGILEAQGALFRSAVGETLIVHLDDEILKPVIMLIVTAVLAYLAKRINGIIEEQINASVERARIRARVTAGVGETTGAIREAGLKLQSVAEQYATGLQHLLGATRNIEQETLTEQTAVEQSSATVAEMIQSIESVSSSIDHQSRLMGESAGAVESVQDSVSQIMGMAKEADGIADALLEAARSGGSVVEDVNVAARETLQAGEQIREVVQVITSVAEATNLLAMNAAIEAAHAGSAGRGFAVVAEEIRKLSEDTSQNAAQIAGFLEDMRSRIATIDTRSASARQALESIVADAGRTSEVNSKIREAMEAEYQAVQRLAQGVEQLATITRDVKHASDEQAAGGSQILEAMSELRTQAGTVSNLTAEQSERGNEVARIADELQAIIGQNQTTIQRLEAVVEELRSADGARAPEEHAGDPTSAQ